MGFVPHRVSVPLWRAGIAKEAEIDEAVSFWRLPAFPHRYQRFYNVLPRLTHIQSTSTVDKSLITR